MRQQDHERRVEATHTMQTLERRILFSSVVLTQGVLTVVGGPGADVVQLNLNDAGDVVVGIVGEAGRAFPGDEVNLVVVRTLAGDDQVLVSDGSGEEGEPAFNVALHVDGGAGDDLIARGNRATSPAVLVGGAGDDTIVGGLGGGENLILGGAGNDSIEAGAGVDVIFGGPGDDTVSGAGEDDVLVGVETTVL